MIPPRGARAMGNSAPAKSSLIRERLNGKILTAAECLAIAERKMGEAIGDRRHGKDPPDHAVVLSVDEKSQIQALDRTQPGLPMKKGRAGTVTHDYKRHGVTTLFAALNVLEGKVIGQCMKRHRHQEFIRFLNVIEARVSKKKTIHVIVDNYATHKHPDVMEWLEKHRRFVFHFTPTSASWLNAIEGFFAKLTKKSLKRGVFRSLRELKDAIHRFLDHTNANPKPFTWTKDPNKIIAAVRRGHQVLDSIH